MDYAVIDAIFWSNRYRVCRFNLTNVIVRLTFNYRLTPSYSPQASHFGSFDFLVHEFGIFCFCNSDANQSGRLKTSFISLDRRHVYRFYWRKLACYVYHLVQYVRWYQCNRSILNRQHFFLEDVNFPSDTQLPIQIEVSLNLEPIDQSGRRWVISLISNTQRH